MNKFHDTILEISNILAEKGIEFVLTRFDKNSSNEPNDLDILVKSSSFKKTIKALEKNGYLGSSHDQALGGRIKGMQKNLIKQARIKIDLHRDFTWRKTRYFDLNLIWEQLEKNKINSTFYQKPKYEVDIFIVIVNIIFEKTYMTSENFNHIKTHALTILMDPNFEKESKKYGWYKTFVLFRSWFMNLKPVKFPIFLPIYLILFSYMEKSIYDKKTDLVSLLYYIFFKARFAINKKLPYE